MSNIIKKESFDKNKDLILVETLVSNKTAGHKYGEYNRISLVKVPKNVNFVKITQKNFEVIESKIYRKSTSKKPEFFNTNRYKNSAENKTIEYFKALFDDTINEKKAG